MTPRRIAIVGAGMTGLALAHRLLARARASVGHETGAIDVRLFEAASRAGGHAHTTRQDGYLMEAGPNGWLDRYEAPRAMVEELGLASSLIAASEASKRRFVVRGGRLRRAPDSPSTLLTSDALSLAGRLRVLAEPLVPARRNDAPEETVDAFARRRLGAEAADALVDSMIAGITAGDSRMLSLDAAFPMMRALEREHGSLIRGFVAGRRAGAGAPRLVAPREGMSSLVGALCEAIGSDRIALDTAVTGLVRAPGGAWRVALHGGATHDADHVVLAAPAHAAAAIVSGVDPALADTLAGVRFAGVAVVAFAYRTADLPRPLDGYGYLLTRGEKRATLGVVWESSLFPGRAPEGHALMRVILGGERRPDVAGMPADEVVPLARRELEAVLGVRATPVLHGAIAWPNAIAQYVVGHTAHVAEARTRAARHPGLSLCGTSYDGNSFASAVAAGRALADRLLEEGAGAAA